MEIVHFFKEKSLAKFNLRWIQSIRSHFLNLNINLKSFIDDSESISDKILLNFFYAKILLRWTISI